MMRSTFPVAVHLFFLRDDQVLLLRRFNTGYEDGSYGVPAGHLEGGEPVRMAAVREAREELGIRIDPKGIDFAGVFHRQSDEERVDFFFAMRDWDGEIRNAEPDKCDQLLWVGMNALPDNTIPYVRLALKNYKSRQYFQEYGWST
jgi:8-oxo-dGTP diphosphatase